MDPLEHFPPTLPVQMQALWQQFAQTTGSRDQAQFHQWLTQQGYLPSLNPLIEVTPFDAAEDFLRTMGIDPVSSEAGQTRQTRPLSPRLQYDLLGTLGKGAMGMVHLAKDRHLQRQVAYKQLLSQQNRSAQARFLREAQITAQLDHPHIVPIYSMESPGDGKLAYSMKLIQGKTFKVLIQETRSFYDQGQEPDAGHALPQLLDYFLKVCDAVAYAHSKGVIHRDLKPANIMVGRYGEVYVMDWGIARVMHQQDETAVNWVELETQTGDDTLEERTQEGQILGTPRYMSPQQAAGKNDELDGRSDLFALGLILFELLTLQPAFQASTPLELLKKVLKAEKSSWAAYAPSRKIPVELQAIADKATARKLSQRYADVTAFAADLRRYLRGEAPLARPDNAWRRLARWVGQHRDFSLLALLLVCVCAAGAVIWHLVDHQLELERARQREAALLHFLTRISQQGQRMDIHFQKMETLLQGLAESTTYALTHGQAGQEPLYLNDATARPPHKRFDAPDLIQSPHYDGEISTTWPVFLLSPGLTPQAIEPRLRQIAPLRQALKQVLMRSHSNGPAMSPAQWQQQLAFKGVPVVWAYICLREGVEYFYPGAEETTEGYDVRIRPYYLQSVNRPEIVWGAPYDDTGETGGLMIPCTRGIFDEQQHFLGTVGLDLRISDLDRAYLRLPDMPAVKASYLLNARGEIVLRSGDALKPKRRLRLNEKNVLRLYALPEVVSAIRSQHHSGTLTDRSVSPPRLIVYYRLSSLGWYYVVEADSANVFAPGGPDEPKP